MMTLKEAREQIARLRTDGLPWDIRLDVTWDGCSPSVYDRDPGFEVEVSWSPTDTDTGKKNTFKFNLAMRPGENILDAGRRAIRVIALHEIDEQLTVDGIRRWEPHLVDGDQVRRPILRRVENDAG